MGARCLCFVVCVLLLFSSCVLAACAVGFLVGVDCAFASGFLLGADCVLRALTVFCRWFPLGRWLYFAFGFLLDADISSLLFCVILILQ